MLLPALESWSRILLRTEGLDKSCKLLQYCLKLSALHSGGPSKRLAMFLAYLSQCRKVLRLEKPFYVTKDVLRGPPLHPTALDSLEYLNHFLSFIVDMTDNLNFASQFNLIDPSRLVRLTRACLRLWWVTVVIDLMCAHRQFQRHASLSNALSVVRFCCDLVQSSTEVFRIRWTPATVMLVCPIISAAASLTKMHLANATRDRKCKDI